MKIWILLAFRLAQVVFVCLAERSSSILRLQIVKRELIATYRIQNILDDLGFPLTAKDFLAEPEIQL